MKAFTVLVLSLFLTAGLVGAASAQSDAPKAPDVKTPDVKIDIKPPDVKPPDVKPPDVKIEGKIETKQESPAASPQTEVGGGRIFGMNSTVALVVGAAFVLVVILALVAMTRKTT